MIIRPMEQRDFAACESAAREAFWNVYRPGCVEHLIVRRLESSPEEYFRKKLAGRFITRIISAASTEREVLISMRFMARSFTVEISWWEITQQTMKTAVPSSSGTLPLLSTKPVRDFVTGVSSMPTSTTSRDSAPMSTASLRSRQSFRYTIRSGIPILRSGSGR